MSSKKARRAVPLLDWNNQPIGPQPKTTPASVNPMIDTHGACAIEGATCGSCVHIVGIAYSRPVYKCKKRDGLTHSRKTDQARRWPACALYEQREGPMGWYDGR